MTDTRSVVVERLLAHAPEKIWRALTQGVLLEEWLMPNDFQPVVGHRFQFRAPAAPNWSGVLDCEVLIVEPNARLAYTWNTAEADGGMQSVVTFTLTRMDGGTLLRMEQSGFRADQEQNYRGANYGWQRNLGNLEKLLAKGIE